jgi:hypothetical protein
LKELSAGYLDANLSVHNTAGTQDFFRGEAALYATELQVAEDRLIQFRQQQNLTSMPEQKELLLHKAMDFEASLRENRRGACGVAESRSRAAHAGFRSGTPRGHSNSGLFPINIPSNA